MTITRDIIRDLLPVYLAGEASPDTRKLVEERAAGDPEIARWIAEGGLELPAPPALRSDAELATLRRTRRVVALRGWLLGFAIFFSALPASVHKGETGGVRWFVLEQPMWALGLGLVGVVLWIAWAAQGRRLRTTGL